MTPWDQFKLNNNNIFSSYAMSSWFIKLGLLLIIIPIFVPFSPKMPTPSIDGSWALGLNQAVSAGLIFGKQIIFTLGPYSSIYTQSYHPATDGMMMAGSFYLACSYWVCLLLLTDGAKRRWILVLAILFFAMIYSMDALLLSYPFLVGVTLINLKDKKECQLFYAVILLAPFGLLCLIKGTLIILSLLVAMVCALFFIIQNKKKLALICLLVPCVSSALFWIAAGQPVVYLPDFFLSSISLAAGFSEAMSNEGNTWEVILYLATSSLIFSVIIVHKKAPSLNELFLFFIFFMFLFLSFKAGFTRHIGHSFTTGTSILIAALVLPFLFNSRLVIPVIIFSLFTSVYIITDYTKIAISERFKTTYLTAWYGLTHRISEKNWATTNFTVLMNYYREQADFPILKGATDIYSYGQIYLLASGSTWSPRPIFQSYSVFNAAMAEKNKAHLDIVKPENIIFSLEPLDSRLPSLEDGASWPVLMQNYYLSDFKNKFLFLKRNTTHTTATPKLLKTETHRLGEVVNVPDVARKIYITLDLRPTIWGSLSMLFYKPTGLEITLHLKNGREKKYRMIANMAKSGFLLSPLIENTLEFAELYRQHEVDAKQVTSFMISPINSTAQWHHKYLIHFNIL